MEFDIEQRAVAMSVGEFAGFSLGPQEVSGGGSRGIWRAQLGTHWHRELRTRLAAENAGAAFEVVVDGQVFHKGWTFSLAGRIDQTLPPAGPAGATLREIKSVAFPLPAVEQDLRAEYPEYFIQLATYAALHRLAAGAHGNVRAELVFVETDSGLLQTIELPPSDDNLFRAQLERIVQFLNLRLQARERLRRLRFRPAFGELRPGQESTRAELDATLAGRTGPIFFEAPTGFGKTGILLESALGQLATGRFERVLYLTSKSTGQLQVVSTLGAMTGTVESQKLKVESKTLSGLSTFNPQLSTADGAASTRSVAVWHVRNKSEHCVNRVFHCVREQCAYLDGMAARWPASGLQRFFESPDLPRDIESLRQAGRVATICPYEITRAALAFNDVWIGDYNYVFSPRHRGFFFGQPGFQPKQSLLIVDEAHNLPSRTADAFTHAFSSGDAFAASAELNRIRPPARFLGVWEQWTHFLRNLSPCDALDADSEDEARRLVAEMSSLLASTPIDYAELSADAAAIVWSLAAAVSDLESNDLPRLWWCPRTGELTITCLDAASAIGAVLREFGGAIMASATFGPPGEFAAACGLDTPPEEPELAVPTAAPERLGGLNKRETRKLYKQLTTAAELLKVEETSAAAAPAVLEAFAPWRENAYDVACDARVDTTFQHRVRYHAVTAATVESLHAVGHGPVAIFFPSYAYAESIERVLVESGSALRVALQPRRHETAPSLSSGPVLSLSKGLSAQASWIESSLETADALFLVLGSSFAESIDLLGGRIARAMVVGPALPEVNAVQRARMAELAPGGHAAARAVRDAAFRRVYQIPGMTKVNQALGRLVRAPGQRARVLLHCRRFAETDYAELLATDFRSGTILRSDADLGRWLAAGG